MKKVLSFGRSHYLPHLMLMVNVVQAKMRTELNEMKKGRSSEQARFKSQGEYELNSKKKSKSPKDAGKKGDGSNSNSASPEYVKKDESAPVDSESGALKNQNESATGGRNDGHNQNQQKSQEFSSMGSKDHESQQYGMSHVHSGPPKTSVAPNSSETFYPSYGNHQSAPYDYVYYNQD